MQSNKIYVVTSQFDMHTCDTGRVTVNPGAMFKIQQRMGRNRIYFVNSQNYLPSSLTSEFLRVTKYEEYIPQKMQPKTPDWIPMTSGIKPKEHQKIYVSATNKQGQTVEMETEYFSPDWEAVNGLTLNAWIPLPDTYKDNNDISQEEYDYE